MESNQPYSVHPRQDKNNKNIENLIGQHEQQKIENISHGVADKLKMMQDGKSNVDQRLDASQFKKKVRVMDLSEIWDSTVVIENNIEELRHAGIDIKVPRRHLTGEHDSNKNLMITMLKIVYLNFLEVNIKDVFKQVTETYEIRNIKEYSHNIQRLTPLFRKVGAVRPYYICLKIREIHDSYYVSDGHNGLDFNEIWSLYPSLIESLQEFFAFLDFQYSSLLRDGYFMSKILNKQSTTFFTELFQGLAVPRDLIPVCSCGRHFCIQYNPR